MMDEDIEEEEEEIIDFKIDEATDDEDWVKPNYKEKGWLKKNCLLCQTCKKTYADAAGALKCFNKHKDKLRCYVCFYTIKGGKNGTKRLFRHYEKRHQQGTRKQTLKCVHCSESVPYGVMSCHIISTHLEEALGTTQKKGAAAKGARGGARAGPSPSGRKAVAASKKLPKKKGETSDEDEESEDDDSTDDNDKPEDKNKIANGRKAGTRSRKKEEEEEDDEDGGSSGEEEKEEGDDDDDDGSSSSAGKENKGDDDEASGEEGDDSDSQSD